MEPELGEFPRAAPAAAQLLSQISREIKGEKNSKEIKKTEGPASENTLGSVSLPSLRLEDGAGVFLGRSGSARKTSEGEEEEPGRAASPGLQPKAASGNFTVRLGDGFWAVGGIYPPKSWFLGRGGDFFPPQKLYFGVWWRFSPSWKLVSGVSW